MIRRMIVGGCAVVLAWPLFAGAQDITGTVVRVDEAAGVIVLQDGRMYGSGASAA